VQQVSSATNIAIKADDVVLENLTITADGGGERGGVAGTRAP